MILVMLEVAAPWRAALATGHGGIADPYLLDGAQHVGAPTTLRMADEDVPSMRRRAC